MERSSSVRDMEELEEFLRSFPAAMNLAGADLFDLADFDTDIVDIFLEDTVDTSTMTKTETWSPTQYINVESPASILKPNNKSSIGGSSGSEQSDDETIEIETGFSPEQSTLTHDSKRIRRMESNRESARKSREKKQAHLANLQLLVDQLQEQKTSLQKQLGDANQQFSEAVMDNHVLSSGVEALRIKVKMVDLVVRSSFTFGLDSLLQNHIGVNNGSIPMMNTHLPFHQGPQQVLPVTREEAEAFNSSMQTDMQLQGTGMVTCFNLENMPATDVRAWDKLASNTTEP
ncbi:Basic-leucine zipper domain-containing protein [Dioscorea alata]|uniref:Basic-leucine zipper domain-containing protein n=1 Tax=Dioscorea alata TaxID=55571 RepID=A0ACB7VDB4_DIOAL|nr:Basic-leucine zipper domain-containing protein [Dioscorea alata]